MDELTPTDLAESFEQLGLANVPVIAHASLKAFGRVQGGPPAFVDALLHSFRGVMMPTHTYRPMLTPLVGPHYNGLNYARWNHQSVMAEFFHPNLPADPMMGIIPETLRQRSDARRSMHPVLSFAGVGVNSALNTQTLDDPLAPINKLAELGGWVLLLGVDHTVNTSIHLGEKLAGRKQFTRWALTPQGVVAFRGFPGCSAGFNAILPEIAPFIRRVTVGPALVQAVQLIRLVTAVIKYLKADPRALICPDPGCERCNEIRYG